MSELEKAVNDLYQARLKQFEAKKDLLRTAREHELTRAKAYLKHSEEETHYRATALAATDPAVVKAREADEQAQLEHYRVWVEAAKCAGLVKGAQEDIPFNVAKTIGNVS